MFSIIKLNFLTHNRKATDCKAVQFFSKNEYSSYFECKVGTRTSFVKSDKRTVSTVFDNSSAGKVRLSTAKTHVKFKLFHSIRDRAKSAFK